MSITHGIFARFVMLLRCNEYVLVEGDPGNGTEAADSVSLSRIFHCSSGTVVVDPSVTIHTAAGGQKHPSHSSLSYIIG